MITSQKIEQLAFQGKCRWQVFWTGYGSTYTIPVPDGGFVLLRQIMYNPFYQGDTKAKQIINTIHQLTLSEQGSNNELIYQFRDPVRDVTVGGAATHYQPGQGLQIIETWGTFKKNVMVDILNAPDVRDATYPALAPLAAEGQEKTDPLGYGIIPVIPNVLITASEKYFPTGEQRPFLGLPFGGAGCRDRVRFDVTAGRQIISPTMADADRQFQFPLIGFGIWIFNIPISEYLNSGN